MVKPFEQYRTPFQAQKMMAKVKAIKRTKNWRAELVQLHKKDWEFNDRPNNDDTEEDDSGYESENWGEPWKNYEDEHYITNKELEIVLRQIFEEYTAWDLRYLNLGLTKRNMFFPFIIHVEKFTNHGWRKKTYFASQKKIYETMDYVTKSSLLKEYHSLTIYDESQLTVALFIIA